MANARFCASSGVSMVFPWDACKEAHFYCSRAFVCECWLHCTVPLQCLWREIVTLISILLLTYNHCVQVILTAVDVTISPKYQCRKNVSNALNVPSTDQTKRLQCTTKTVNLHVRLTQVACRWSTKVRGIELKPSNNIKHGPVITKFSSRKSKSNPWFTSTLRAFKSTVRRAEIIWKRTHSALNWSSFKSLRNRYHNLILTYKKQYYSNLVSSLDNPRRLWQTINNLLYRNSSSPLPTYTSASALADSLASFFTPP